MEENGNKSNAFDYDKTNEKEGKHVKSPKSESGSGAVEKLSSDEPACPDAIGGNGDSFSKDECAQENIRAVKSVMNIERLSLITLGGSNRIDMSLESMQCFQHETTAPKKADFENATVELPHMPPFSSPKIVENVKEYVRQIENTSHIQEIQSNAIEIVESRKESTVLIDENLPQKKLESVVVEQFEPVAVGDLENVNLQRDEREGNIWSAERDRYNLFLDICGLFRRHLDILLMLIRVAEERTGVRVRHPPSFEEGASMHSLETASAPNIDDELFPELLCEPSILNLAETTPTTEESTTLTVDAPAAMSQVESSMAYQTADLETVPDYTQQPESSTLGPNMVEDERDTTADQSGA